MRSAMVNSVVGACLLTSTQAQVYMVATAIDVSGFQLVWVTVFYFDRLEPFIVQFSSQRNVQCL